MADAPVFISYSSKDRKIANTLCAALEARGLRCWIASRDVGPGQNFQEAIVKAIRRARVMLLVFSANANNSDEIKKELALASRYGLAVIPARVEDVVPSEAFELEFATRQWVDLFDEWEASVERLHVWIKGLIEASPAVAPEDELEDSEERTEPPAPSPPLRPQPDRMKSGPPSRASQAVAGETLWFRIFGALMIACGAAMIFDFGRGAGWEIYWPEVLLDAPLIMAGACLFLKRDWPKLLAAVVLLEHLNQLLTNLDNTLFFLQGIMDVANKVLLLVALTYCVYLVATRKHAPPLAGWTYRILPLALIAGGFLEAYYRVNEPFYTELSLLIIWSYFLSASWIFIGLAALRGFDWARMAGMVMNAAGLAAPILLLVLTRWGAGVNYFWPIDPPWDLFNAVVTLALCVLGLDFFYRTRSPLKYPG